MEELMKILQEVRPDVDFEKETKLIDDSVFDSFDIISIVAEINDIFSINVNAADLLPENFNSASAIWELVKHYQNI